LIGYKSSSSTDEEFLLCTTDKARQYIEEAQKRVQKELEQQVERSMNRLIGPWDPKGSEKDIEDVKPVPTRERVCLMLYSSVFQPVCRCSQGRHRLLSREPRS